jgi:NAD(P)-dependent dehydrogenase (short-subunit alcohol dehydrogenase family)
LPKNPPFKVVVVTGASAGIGRATALDFADQGAAVALIARNQERLEQLRKEIEAAGGKALVLPLDVADAAGVEAAAGRVETELGPIDVWVNNAMVSVFSPAIDMQPAEYRRVAEVTYLGGVYGTLAALRRMRSRNHGRIVLVGSALAYRGIPLQSAYCAAKHALQGFNDSLQCELRHDRSGVRLTMVQLSAFNTPQFDWVKSRLANKARPMGTVFQPELAARAIVWAAQYGGRELIVGWPAWYATWLNKFFPALGDRYLAYTGYDGQQSNEMKEVHPPENLWESVPGNYGAHGRFDAVAKRRSAQLWLATHTRLASAILVTAVLLSALAWFHD